MAASMSTAARYTVRIALIPNGFSKIFRCVNRTKSAGSSGTAPCPAFIAWMAVTFLNWSSRNRTNSVSFDLAAFSPQ